MRGSGVYRFWQFEWDVQIMLDIAEFRLYQNECSVNIMVDLVLYIYYCKFVESRYNGRDSGVYRLWQYEQSEQIILDIAECTDYIRMNAV